jgi:hypothetical protein
VVRVVQVAAAGAAGETDIDKLTRDLMQKLGGIMPTGTSMQQQQRQQQAQFYCDTGTSAAVAGTGQPDSNRSSSTSLTAGQQLQHGS